MRRQSVSVVVSDAAAASMNLTDLKAMVAAAAGVDDTRGDVVSVSKMAFDTTAAQTAQIALDQAVTQEKAAAAKSMYIDIAKWAVVGLAVLLVFFLILRVSKRLGESERTTLSLEAVEALGVPHPLGPRGPRSGSHRARLSEAAGQLGAAPSPDMESVAAGVRDEIMAFAAAQPAEVAEVLRGWLVSGRRQ